MSEPLCGYLFEYSLVFGADFSFPFYSFTEKEIVCICRNKSATKLLLYNSINWSLQQDNWTGKPLKLSVVGSTHEIHENIEQHWKNDAFLLKHLHLHYFIHDSHVISFYECVSIHSVSDLVSIFYIILLIFFPSYMKFINRWLSFSKWQKHWARLFVITICVLLISRK